jgi:hypothetical protein
MDPYCSPEGTVNGIARRRTQDRVDAGQDSSEAIAELLPDLTGIRELSLTDTRTKFEKLPEIGPVLICP